MPRLTKKRRFRNTRQSTRWGIIGNDRAISFLQQQLIYGERHHAYLLAGPAGVGKSMAAAAFARTALCRRPQNGMACEQCLSCVQGNGLHPDQLVIRSERIVIDDMRKLVAQTHRRPAVAQRQVIIIEHAHRMTEEAANAFLKTLEEPRNDARILLTTENPTDMSLTVRSRCVMVQFSAVPDEIIREFLRDRGISPSTATNLAYVAQGKPGLALTLSEHPAEYERIIDMTNALGEIISAPLARRIQLIRSFLSPPADRQAVADIIDCWENVAHRLLRQVAGLSDRGPLAERLGKRVSHWTIRHVRTLIDGIVTAKDRLRSNMNSKLILESLAIHIPRA